MNSFRLVPREQTHRRDTTAVVRDLFVTARPEHWIKNIFMLFGTALALFLYPDLVTIPILFKVVIALAAACLIASSNYVLNGILDAPRDRKHPEKCTRPLARNVLSVRAAWLEWLILGLAGMALAWVVAPAFFFSSLALLIMGIVYNVPPLRSKEIPIVDVLSEAINNPIRLLMGWYAVGVLTSPPSSLLFGYWMLGAFGMAAKRLAEYRELGDATVAASYRNSFAWYTEDRLVMTIIAYASGFMFFFAVILTKYRPELILSAPFLIVLMGYIVKLTYEPHSIVQNPERLFRKPMFVGYVLFCLALLYMLSVVHLPEVQTFLGINGRPW